MLLKDPSGYLDRGTRKQVLWRDLQAFSKTDERMLRELLKHAVAIDKERTAGLR
jgi:hypothetical protein